MTDEKIKEAAAELLEAIHYERGGSEISGLRNPDPLVKISAYKPFYAACATLLSPYDRSFRAKVLGEGFVSLEDAKAICSAAHPFYKKAIEREPDHFKATYGFIRGAWDDDWIDED